MVKEFKLQRYLGKWYEITRLDNSFERGLIQVSTKFRHRLLIVKKLQRIFDTRRDYLESKWGINAYNLAP